MKLLFDENLSPRLVRLLSDLFPGSAHIVDVLELSADDGAIWELARRDGFVIVSKDSDFNDISVVRGAPPKVVWMRVGNADATGTALILRRRHADLAAFVEDATLAVWVLFDRGDDPV